ncbi:uncharacterized protein LOC135835620 [Planococcus citri]|uniref:uncharacterized protein LOC135835620 n=1 Tax=Planococcus citri TaxID=170843 RepID=UPI0031F908AD
MKKYELQESNNNEATHQQTSDASDLQEAPQPPEYTTEKLVPASDFAFELWKKPTFHVLNEDRMNEKLIYRWTSILEAIQNHAHNFQLEFSVYTKTFDPPKENLQNQENIDTESKPKETFQHEENIETESKPQAPQIWIKIVHQHNKEHDTDNINSRCSAVAIIVNNHMDNTLNKYISLNYCDKKNYCKKFQEDKYSEMHKYIKCCAINKNIEQLYNFDLKLTTRPDGMKELLWIDTLIQETDVDDYDEEDVKQDTKMET